MPALGRQRQENLSGLLASQPSLIGNPTKTPSQKQNKQLLKVYTSSCPLTSIPMHTSVFINTHTCTWRAHHLSPHGIDPAPWGTPNGKVWRFWVHALLDSTFQDTLHTRLFQEAFHLYKHCWCLGRERNGRGIKPLKATDLGQMRCFS